MKFRGEQADRNRFSQAQKLETLLSSFNRLLNVQLRCKTWRSHTQLFKTINLMNRASLSPTAAVSKPKTSALKSLLWNQSINQSCIFRVVQVIKSLRDPLEVGNNLPGISYNVREWGLEQKCFLNADGRLTEMGQISHCPAGYSTWWVRWLGRPGRRR